MTEITRIRQLAATYDKTQTAFHALDTADTIRAWEWRHTLMAAKKHRADRPSPEHLTVASDREFA